MRVIVGQDAGAVMVLDREMGGMMETICAWMRVRDGRMLRVVNCVFEKEKGAYARRDSLERAMLVKRSRNQL